ncbi:MAG: hypothetical protein AB7H88_08745 [Vicinamibacterales bacterium]
MRRALALLLGVALLVGPTTTTVVLAAAGMGMACCDEMAAATTPCHETGTTLTCCHPDQSAPPAAPAPATASAPVAPGADGGALLQPADAPMVAVVASRDFAAWSGRTTGPPTHLLLSNFRI